MTLSAGLYTPRSLNNFFKGSAQCSLSAPEPSIGKGWYLGPGSPTYQQHIEIFLDSLLYCVERQVWEGDVIGKNTNFPVCEQLICC